MQGKIVSTGKDSNGNTTYGIKFHHETYAVLADDVLLRRLEPGAKVNFMTDRETGVVLIQFPSRSIGCERNRG
ncbi:MAG: hypothetical protein UV55_C0048G0004 [Candidatus Gottesmanbacteria bacterium GW2011_GWC1_43_10]|nr:MAG: hypothetical protein UV55_C0048G0004 [Candidatus Gottesmanbacteria bacterium GW2011_GWC1_43_10]